MRLTTLIRGVFLFCLLWFLGWQTWGVVAARNHLDPIFEPYGDGALWSDLSPERQALLLAAEDPGFLRHRGIDLAGPGVGARTITQELADAQFVGRLTPGWLGMETALIAFLVIDPQIPKPVQAAAFLDMAPFAIPTADDGPPITGYRAAARALFGTDWERLSDYQFASLVALRADPASLPLGSTALQSRIGRLERLAAKACAPRDRQDIWLPDCG